MRSGVKVVAAAGVAALAVWLGVPRAGAQEDFFGPAPYTTGPDRAAWQDYASPRYGPYAPFSPAAAAEYYYGLTPRAYGGSYPMPSFTVRPNTRWNAARLRLMVPANAQVWVDGKLTGQTGPNRVFESPALNPGRSYVYEVKARWRDRYGNEVTRSRTVDVGAGSDVIVDFLAQR